MARITKILAREIYDSRGKPTVEVDVVCDDGRRGRASVPSGASTGQFEACELRDGDAGRLDGTGVLRAIGHIHGEIAAALVGTDPGDQARLDARLVDLDGTPQKTRLGANALLGVSLANAAAAAAVREVPLVVQLHELWRQVGGEFAAPKLRLPLPMVNMISGGLHAGRNLDFQDFLIIPLGATSVRQACEWIITVYRRLGKLLAAAGHEGVLVGDEGGYGPKLRSNSEAVEFVLQAIAAAGLVPGRDVALALDVASTHFYRDGTYQLSATGDTQLSSADVVEMLAQWVENYPIVSIEDGLADADWSGWQALTARLGDRVQLIGDDLFTTNAARLARGIASGAANSVLIKVNQIGTLSETFATLRLALEKGYLPVISARSGETEDPLLADLAVATGAGQIKIGSIARSERLAKYNQLLRLEEELGGAAEYLGGGILSRFTPRPRSSP